MLCLQIDQLVEQVEELATWLVRDASEVTSEDAHEEVQGAMSTHFDGMCEDA